MAQSGKQSWANLMTTLIVIVNEDIGPGDWEALHFVQLSIMELREHYERTNGDTHGLLLMNVIMRMCRAKKSRDAGHLLVTALYKLDNQGVPEPPDCAHDMHTSRGKRMGRGIEHFLKEGAVLDNEVEAKWKAVAHEIWRLTLHRKNYDVTPERKAQAQEFLDRHLGPRTRNKVPESMAPVDPESLFG